MRTAQRIANLPPYLFAEIDKKIDRKKKEGVDVISLGIGDPVEPTPDNIVRVMAEQVANPANHRYPSYFGMPAFRQAVADWYGGRVGRSFDPETEVLPLIGSKEGIAHIHVALVDPGDLVLVPDPGYPVYKSGTILAGGIPRMMPLVAGNDYMPDLEAIDPADADKAKIMFLNYPNNPTAGVADLDFFKKAVEFARKYDIVICHDFPYSEIVFDGYRAPSLLEVEGADEVAIEFHSLSKTYNMTGWRIGWAIGNRQVIEALGRVKSNIDSGIFNAIQLAGIEALTGPQEIIGEMTGIYERRRNTVVETLKSIGVEAALPKGTIYVWHPVPEGYTSAGYAEAVLERAGVVVSPGNAYGPSGEGYARISLAVKDDRLKEALERIREAL